MIIEIIPMVEETCDRCGERSGVIPRRDLAGWRRKHNMKHDAEDREERLKLLGHECRVVDNWMEMDDSGGRVVCDCGYKSPEAKLCWMEDFIQQHLAEVEASLLRAWEEEEAA